MRDRDRRVAVAELGLEPDEVPGGDRDADAVVAGAAALDQRGQRRERLVPRAAADQHLRERVDHPRPRRVVGDELERLGDRVLGGGQPAESHARDGEQVIARGLAGSAIARLRQVE